jgi:cold shock CspA family protein
MQEREVGVIKRFYSIRHFGFIGRTGEQDLFFHEADLERGDSEIREGGRVEFEIALDQLGRLRASAVELL